MDLFEYFIELAGNRDQSDLQAREFFYNIILPLLAEFNGKNLPIIQHFDLRQKNNVNELKFHFDKLLSLMIAYSKPENVMQSVKDRINESKHPVFQLIWHILDGCESEFLSRFDDSMEFVESYCAQSYQSPSNNPYYIASFQMIMFSGAIIHNRKQIIQLLSISPLFNEVDLILPKNIETYKYSDYISSIILKRRQSVLSSKNNLLKKMISSNVFKEFLDSRISRSENENRIKIDTSFLMIKNSESLSFQDSTESLDYIYQNDELQNHVSHPTLASYVDLKYYMYKKIFFWNFWCFFILTVVYVWNAYDIIRNASFYFSEEKSKAQSDFDTSVLIVIILMICRESFQVWIFGGFREYFQRSSNKLELLLIMLLLFTTSLDVYEYYEDEDEDDEEYDSNFERMLFVNLTCFNILAMTMLLMTMVPYNFMYRYMLLFKKVARTFIKFLLTFMSVVSAFIFVFMIVFHSENEKYDNISDKNNANDDHFPKHFHVDHVGVAFVKVILMLSGEYETNLLERGFFQLVFIAMFVVVTFICFNLIIGLTINDVQVLTKDVMHTSVLKRTLKIIQINQNYSKFCLKMNR